MSLPPSSPLPLLALLDACQEGKKLKKYEESDAREKGEHVFSLREGLDWNH